MSAAVGPHTGAGMCLARALLAKGSRRPNPAPQRLRWPLHRPSASSACRPAQHVHSSWLAIPSTTTPEIRFLVRSIDPAKGTQAIRTAPANDTMPPAAQPCNCQECGQSNSAAQAKCWGPRAMITPMAVAQALAEHKPLRSRPTQPLLSQTRPRNDAPGDQPKKPGGL